MLRTHEPFFEYGDADSLPPQDTTHISAQSIAIRSARGFLKTNRGLYCNLRFFLFRARGLTLVTRAVAVFALPKQCSLNYVSLASFTVLQKPVSKGVSEIIYIIEIGCTNFLRPVRNASLHLHLRETKLERGRGIASRSTLCHRQCRVDAYRRQQGATDMIRESAKGGRQPIIHRGRVRVDQGRRDHSGK